MIFTSELPGMSDTSTREKPESYDARRTEKYVFLISAAVASFFTPSTWYGSLGADRGVEAWKSRWFRPNRV